MTKPTEHNDDWRPDGEPVSGAKGIILVGAAVIWHVVSLQWLLAPRWKDKVDARRELDRL